MASKSFGQIAGTVVGAAIGFFAGGNVALGASIGGMIGGMIDPPKGPTVVGPRLDDLSFQTSTLGAPLGRAYGTVPILGNVVWLEGDKYREVITSEEQGGKGGSTSTYETAHYYATFAVSLLRVTDATKTIALRRLWIGSNLVYDAGSDNLESIIASNSQSALFTFYSGSDDQQPNTRWQADKGANAVSGFPGRCYIVIYDLDLEPYSRSLAMAQVKVELAVGDVSYQTETLTAIQTFNPLGWTPQVARLKGVVYGRGELTTCFCHDNNWDGYVYGSTFANIEYAVSQKNTSSISTPLAGVGYLHVEPSQITLTQTDTDAIILLEDMYNAGEVLRLHINESVGNNFPSYGITIKRLGIYDSDDLYIFGNGNTPDQVSRIDLSGGVLNSAGSYASESGGASENYIFLAAYTGVDTGTQTIYKLARSDLSLVSTHTGSAHSFNTVISVESDRVFYTMSKNYNIVYKWVDGVIVDSKSGVVPTGNVFSFKVYSFDPVNIVTTIWGGSSGTIHIGHGVVAQEVAKLRDVVTSECTLAGLQSGDIDLTGLTNSDVRGYRIANSGSIRSSLEMLQAAFPFDVAPSGYNLRFVSRGGASLATIPEVDLGAVAGSESSPVLLPMAREMDTQIPYKVSVRYLDPAREYDIGEQYASRPDTDSVSERTVELSLVMTGDEAAQVADVLNQKDWLERTSFGPFTLPPTRSEIEPPDVVTVEHRGQAHTIRLTRAEFLPDGRIECAGVYSAAQSYTSSATAQESLTVGQSLVPLKGSTQGYLLDIPRIRSEQDVPGMSYGMTGLASGWPGATLLRSEDPGNGYQAVGSVNARLKVFVATEALASHHGYSIDHGAVLTVTPRYSGHTLSSVTEDKLYAHANLAAYGVDGRWEIVAFRSVTDNTGSYTVQDFLRGLYGTEQHSGTHVAGDYLIMLDRDTVSFFGLPTNAIGAMRLYRAITQGASIDSAVDMADTYDANNLKPLSIVDLRGARSDTLDWSVEWSRRSRWPVELFSGFSVPLGETSESYDVDLYDSGYSTVKRSFSGLSSPAFSYPVADQVTDFGSAQTTLYIKAFQNSSVVGRGNGIEESIYRYVGDDPYIDLVVLGLHFDGTNGSTTFTDIRGATVTASGNAQLSTDAAAFGGISGLFDGTGDYLTVTNNTNHRGWGDFTIDGFVTLAATTADYGVFDKRSALTARGLSIFFDNASDKFMFVAGDTDTGSWNVSISSSVVTSATRYHLQFSRGGSTWYAFLNGTLISSQTWSGTIADDTANIQFGAAYSAISLNGRLDDWRATKVCRNTSNFTPRTTAFPDT